MSFPFVLLYFVMKIYSYLLGFSPHAGLGWAERSIFSTRHDRATHHQQHRQQQQELDATIVGDDVTSSEGAGQDARGADAPTGDVDSGRWCHPTKPSELEGLGLAAQDFQSAGKVGITRGVGSCRAMNTILQLVSHTRGILEEGCCLSSKWDPQASLHQSCELSKVPWERVNAFISFWNSSLGSRVESCFCQDSMLHLSSIGRRCW